MEPWNWQQDVVIAASFACGNVISNVGLFTIFQFVLRRAEQPFPLQGYKHKKTLNGLSRENLVVGPFTFLR